MDQYRLDMQLWSLPPEIVRNIADNLGTKELLDLQQCCRGLRKVIAPLIWSHIHLDVSPDMDRMYSRGVDTYRLPRYAGSCESVCRPRTFFNEHKCRRRTIKVDHRCIADFCSAFLSDHDVGAYASAFESTRTLTLNLYDYPSAWVNLELDPATTREEINRQDPATLFTWVLETLIPQKFSKINRIDITTSTRHIRPPRITRLINILWSAFPEAEKNVDLKLLGEAPMLPDILSDSSRIVELKLYNESSSDVNNSLSSLLSNHTLPTSVERFSISCYIGIHFEQLRSFLSQCYKIKDLMIRALLLEECSFDWVPQTVVALSLVDIYCAYNNQTEITTLPNVESLEVISSCPDIFKNLRLPKLKRLKLEGKEISSNHMLQLLTHCHELRQIDASNLTYDQVAEVLNCIPPSTPIDSLVINPSIYIRDYGLDCLIKFIGAVKQHDIQFLLLKAKGWNDDISIIISALLEGLKHCPNLYLDFDLSPRSNYDFLESVPLPDVQSYFRRPNEFANLVVKLNHEKFYQYLDGDAFFSNN